MCGGDMEQSIHNNRQQSRRGSAVEIVPLEANPWNRLHMVMASQHRHYSPSHTSARRTSSSGWFWVQGRGVARSAAYPAANFDGCVTENAYGPDQASPNEHNEGTEINTVVMQPTANWASEVLLGLLWVPIASILAVPMGFSMLSLTLPPGANVPLCSHQHAPCNCMCMYLHSPCVN